MDNMTGVATNLHRQLGHVVYLIIEIVKIFWNKYMDIPHDLQHIETLKHEHNHTLFYSLK